MVVRPIDDAEVWAAAEAFVRALLPKGLRGPCNIQGRITDHGVRFFEANPGAPAAATCARSWAIAK